MIPVWLSTLRHAVTYVFRDKEVSLTVNRNVKRRIQACLNSRSAVTGSPPQAASARNPGCCQSRQVKLHNRTVLDVGHEQLIVRSIHVQPPRLTDNGVTAGIQHLAKGPIRVQLQEPGASSIREVQVAGTVDGYSYQPDRRPQIAQQARNSSEDPSVCVDPVNLAGITVRNEDIAVIIGCYSLRERQRKIGARHVVRKSRSRSTQRRSPGDRRNQTRTPIDSVDAAQHLVGQSATNHWERRQSLSGSKDGQPMPVRHRRVAGLHLRFSWIRSGYPSAVLLSSQVRWHSMGQWMQTGFRRRRSQDPSYSFPPRQLSRSQLEHE